MVKDGPLSAKSGSTNDRAEFQAMFRDASQRKFDVLLFWALGRLSREGVLETLQHLNQLTACGVGYRSFTEQYFDSCGVFKDAVIAIIATVAKQERLRISQRVRAGLVLARARRSCLILVGDGTWRRKIEVKLTGIDG